MVSKTSRKIIIRINGKKKTFEKNEHNNEYMESDGNGTFVEDVNGYGKLLRVSDYEGKLSKEDMAMLKKFIES